MANANLHQPNQSAGFIKLLLLIILVVVILTYLKIDLRQFVATYWPKVANWLEGIFN